MTMPSTLPGNTGSGPGVAPVPGAVGAGTPPVQNGGGNQDQVPGGQQQVPTQVPGGQPPPAQQQQPQTPALPATAQVDWNDPVQRQAEIDRIASRARSEGKSVGKREVEDAAAEAQRLAQQTALHSQGQFQALYDQEKARADALKVEADRAAELTNMFNTQIDEELATWPADNTAVQAIKAMDPGKNDITRRATWMKQARVAIQSVNIPVVAPVAEHGAGSGAQGNGQSVAQVAASTLNNRYPRPDAKK